MSSSCKAISVIIPAYNGSTYIGGAIDCILRQNYKNLEIVVVDDGSTDNTAAIVESYGDQIRYISKTNGGVASARNEGIRQTSGEFIAFLDQDDWWPDDMLENTMKQFEEDPQLQVVMGLSKVVFEEGAIRETYSVGEEQLTAPFVNVSSALFKRTAFDLVGTFNEELHASNDLDWFNRARENKLPLLVLPEVTLFYRRHNENASNDVSWMRMEIIKALKFSLERRRSKTEVEEIPSLNTYIRKE